MKKTDQVVLVTGAAGFVGAALVEHLTLLGYRVIAASRSHRATGQGVDDVLLPSPTDASDDEFDNLLSQAHHVVHLAGLAHTRVEGADAADIYRYANLVLTERLANAAARKRLPGKFLFVSSVRAQCGNARSGIVSETDIAQPTDEYGRTKLAAEQAIARIFGPEQFTILRPVLVYGRGVKGNMATLQNLARMKVPLPLGSLPGRRSLLSRQSLCQAISHCLIEPKTDGNTYIVADRQSLTVGEIVAALRRGLNSRPLVFPFPAALLKHATGLILSSGQWETLAGDLRVSTAALEATGWQPNDDTAKELSMMMNPALPSSVARRSAVG